MKYRNVIYKRGRMIRATYLINYPYDNERIITNNLVVIDDVFETDKDIVCLNIDDPKELIIIPNTIDNIIELPTVLEQAKLNSILSKMDSYISKLQYKCS